MKICRLFSVVVFLGATVSLDARTKVSDEGSVPTLSVCEALAHASRYDGKILRIRDIVGAGDEGAGFVGTQCPGIFVTEGKVWPSVIAWTMPFETDFILHTINFSYDWQSRKNLDKRWRALRKRLPDRCILVTVTGMFEYWAPEGSRKKLANGSITRIDGFGHLDAAPAQLVLKSADNVEPAPNCGP